MDTNTDYMYIHRHTHTYAHRYMHQPSSPGRDMTTTCSLALQRLYATYNCSVKAAGKGVCMISVAVDIAVLLLLLFPLRRVVPAPAVPVVNGISYFIKGWLYAARQDAMMLCAYRKRLKSPPGARPLVPTQRRFRRESASPDCFRPKHGYKG